MNNTANATNTTTADKVEAGDWIRTSTGDLRRVVAAHPFGNAQQFPEVIIWVDCNRNKPEPIRVSAGLTVEMYR